MINLKPELSWITKMAAVITPIVIIGGAYSFYMMNIYKPAVTVSNIDWSLGTATVTAAGRTNTLHKDQKLMAGTNKWSVAFNSDGTRIELLQRGLVHTILAQNT
jgi:hypothetical protein